MAKRTHVERPNPVKEGWLVDIKNPLGKMWDNLPDAIFDTTETRLKFYATTTTAEAHRIWLDQGWTPWSCQP